MRFPVRKSPCTTEVCPPSGRWASSHRKRELEGRVWLAERIERALHRDQGVRRREPVDRVDGDPVDGREHLAALRSHERADAGVLVVAQELAGDGLALQPFDDERGSAERHAIGGIGDHRRHRHRATPPRPGAAPPRRPC